MSMRNNIILALVLAGVWVSELCAAELEIKNRFLAVRYDQASQSFTVKGLAQDLTFLTDAKLEGKAKVAGRDRIVVTQNDGTTTLELRPDQPWLFLTKELVNHTGTNADHQRIVPIAFQIDLHKAVTQLRTMGTAGLTEPDKNPGSYLFLTCADPETRRGVVAGWVTEDRGSGVLFSGVREDHVRFTAAIDHGHLLVPPGKSARLETLAIGLFDDARIGEEKYADLIKDYYKIHLRPIPSAYCSWYAEKHGMAGDEASTIEIARFAAKELKPFGFNVVQVDDEWQDGPKLNGPRRGFDRVRPDGPYKNGMAPVAAEVNKTGMAFGLWWLPFARNYPSPEYKNRQDWFVKRDNGKPYDTDWGGTCLDLTHPQVQKQLADIAKLYRSWGVKYYKMDGLWTGAACEQIYVNDGYKEDHFGNNQPFHNPLVSNIESYRNGLRLLRQSAGNDVFFSGCCIAQNMRELCAIGLVDAMRIGPDYNADGAGIRTGPTRGSRLYFLNGRVWWNDPDPALLRASGSAMGSGSVTMDQARLGASWVGMSGQIFLISDWLPDLPAERLDILKRCLPSHPATARPVDYFDSALPKIWLVNSGQRAVLGLYNWETNQATLACSSGKAGLDQTKTYHAFDFWNDRVLPDFKGDFSYDLSSQSCRIVAVRADEGHPVVVSTSRHVTQGIMDLTDEKWNGSQLSATSEMVAGDTYEVRIAGTEKWKPGSITASTSLRNDLTFTEIDTDSGWLRVKFSPTKSAKVKWRVNFVPR